MYCHKAYMLLLLQSLSHVQLFELLPARVFCPWDSPGKNTGVGCHALLQGIFLTQGSKPCLVSPALAGRFFTTRTTWEAHKYAYYFHYQDIAKGIRNQPRITQRETKGGRGSWHLPFFFSLFSLPFVNHSKAASTFQRVFCI